MAPTFVNHLPHLARGESAFPEMAGELVPSIPLRCGRLTFGRGAQADVVLSDQTLEPHHAVLEYGSAGCYLADQETAAGTFVNGKNIRRVQLQPGDLIHLGTYLFCFKGSHLLWVRQPASPRLAAIGLSQTTPEGVQLLDGVTMVFQPGEFIGLLGPSGAGKTTLLDALNGFRPAQTGRVFLGGEALYENFERLCQVIGYVPQNDLVHPELTSRQALDYVGRLRLPELGSVERENRVAETLELLDLIERADVPIGKLSGGQRKRASVGVELLCKPAVLFLDEPTSGLDPGNEAKLMRTLHELAALGKTIVCTTHTMENVERFDKIAVLAPGGKLVFFGPPQDALEFFGIQEYLDLFERLEAKPACAWQQAFRRHALCRKVRAQAQKERLPKPLNQQIPRSAPGHVSSLNQAITLLCRGTRILAAEPRHFVLALAQPLLMGGLMCLVFDKLPVLSFLLVIAALWFGCSAAAQQIVKERLIYRRERMVNLRLGPYLLSKFVLFALLGLLQSVLLLALVHFWKGSLDWSIYLPTLSLASWNGIALGLIISACAANADKATAVVPLVLLPQIILAGVLVPLADMNRVTTAASHLAAAKWANRAVEIAQFEGKSLTGDLLADDANVLPVWNLYPERDLRTPQGRRHFLEELGSSVIRKREELTMAYGVLGLIVFLQLAAVAAVLRGQDVF
jgi:ABC-type multidrug transport system ATPase subunit